MSWSNKKRTFFQSSVSLNYLTGTAWEGTSAQRGWDSGHPLCQSLSELPRRAKHIVLIFWRKRSLLPHMPPISHVRNAGSHPYSCLSWDQEMEMVATMQNTKIHGYLLASFSIKHSCCTFSARLQSPEMVDFDIYCQFKNCSCKRVDSWSSLLHHLPWCHLDGDFSY